MGIVLPHIIWAPSPRSSCCFLLQSPLCALRPTQLSATPPATTFPTLSGLRSPTPRPRPLSSPTPTLLLSTPPLPDARTRPVPWCLVLTVVLFPSESQLPLLRSLLWRRPGRRGKLRPKPKPIQKPRPRPGFSTEPTATGPSATATLPTATLLTPTPVTMATTDLATTTATTAERRGRRQLRLRPTLGCCMAVTVFLMEATTATATTTRPMPTLEAAVTTSVVSSLVPPADRKERSCQQKIKIDSWNHVLFSPFMFTQRVCQNTEIEMGN